ncbi:MAG: FAD-dependent monooxygenase [Bauldia sp.]|nr:FAD-dependent monooxygenase [Bauldia sp.]
MERNRIIAVAGAGIGGLTAALALARAGFGVRLLERSETLSEAGAGIQISPNAGRVLALLGLDDAVARLSAEPAALEVRSGRSGRRIATLPFGPAFARRYGVPYRTIHRADLLDVLAGAAMAEADVDLKAGHAVSEFAIHARGLTIACETRAGMREVTAAALVAADGAGSLVRRMMPDGAARHPMGRTAWRAVISAEAAPPAMAHDRVGLWLGSGGHVVHYPVRGGREFNLVAVTPDPPAAAAQPAGFGDLMKRFRRWNRDVLAILAAPIDWRRWPITMVDPAAPWARGPVVLLGDAAHAMAPFLAQGGAMAMEDAYVLAQKLALQPDAPAAAFAAFERDRRPRVTRVWNAAHGTADLYHMGGPPAALRNAGMRLAGGGLLLRRYRWIFGWTPPAPVMQRAPTGSGTGIARTKRV